MPRTCNSTKSCEFLGFCSYMDDVSVLLEYDTASLGNWFPAFEDNAVVSEISEPITQ